MRVTHYILMEESLKAQTLISLPSFHFVQRSHLTQEYARGHINTHIRAHAHSIASGMKAASFKVTLITHPRLAGNHINVCVCVQAVLPV